MGMIELLRVQVEGRGSGDTASFTRELALCIPFLKNDGTYARSGSDVGAGRHPSPVRGQAPYNFLLENDGTSVGKGYY